MRRVGQFFCTVLLSVLCLGLVGMPAQAQEGPEVIPGPAAQAPAAPVASEMAAPAASGTTGAPAPSAPAASKIGAQQTSGTGGEGQQQTGGGTGEAQSGKGRFVWVSTDGSTWWTSKTSYELWLAGIVITLLIALVGILALYGWGSSIGLTAEFQRTFLLLTVVFSALFLVAAGYSDRQTAPVFSLLGAIVGYLFGRAPGVEPAAQPDAGKPGDTTAGEAKAANTKAADTTVLVEPKRPGGFPP